jgi:predicted transcriptional regulator
MSPKPTRPVPTPQELEILKVIWQRGEATVREVYRELAETRQIAYTTVLTMMGILEQKGHLTKFPGERANVYRAAEPRERVVRTMVNEFIGRVFSGSAKPLLVHLVDDSRLEPEELDEIEARLRERRDKSGADARSKRGSRTRGSGRKKP